MRSGGDDGMLDLIIKNAKVIDGSGSPWRKADVAVKDGRIVSVGLIGDAEAEEIIDAEGLFLAPGFIDIHSHSDQGVFAHPRAESRILQGVTTELVGNCGISMAPSNDDHVDMLKGYTDGAGDYSWRSMSDFIDKLDEIRPSTNIACMLGHGTLRIAAMGYSAERPDKKQLDAMRALAKEGMEDGAFGITSGLIYPPGSYADAYEVAYVISAVAPYGGFYATHMRNEEALIVESVKESIDTAVRAGVPLQISHHKTCYKPDWRVTPKMTIAMIERARREGHDVTCDQYPYCATATTLSVNIPDWAFEGGFEAVKRRLADKETRARIKREVNDSIGDSWDDYFVSSLASRENAWQMGKSIPEIAQKLGLEPTEAFFKIIVDEDNHVNEVHFAMCEEDVEYIMQRPFVMIGSDGWCMDMDAPGKPHPRNYGTFPRVISRYCRERQLFTLEEAIRKMTGMSANRAGLKDRGYIMEGMWADMVLFDFEKINDDPDFQQPQRPCSGIKRVYVNGVLTARDGVHTGARAGVALRKNRQ